MRHYQIQVVDGTSALKDDDSLQESTGTLNDKNPNYWVIRSRRHADSPYFFERISAEPGSETADVAFKGRLDSTVVTDLIEALYSASMHGPETVLLDLSEVHFISMEGILALIEAGAKLEFQHVRLLLSGVQPEIERLFRVWNALPGTTVFSSRREMKNYLAAMQKRSVDDSGFQKYSKRPQWKY